MKNYCSTERAARPVATEATPAFLRDHRRSEARAVSAERSAPQGLGLSPRETLAWSCVIGRHVEPRLVSAHGAIALMVIGFFCSFALGLWIVS